MTPEQRLAFIQACERTGLSLETYDHRGMCVVLVNSPHGAIVAHAIHPTRFDFEEAYEQWTAWKQSGGRLTRTRKAA